MKENGAEGPEGRPGGGACVDTLIAVECRRVRAREEAFNHWSLQNPRFHGTSLAITSQEEDGRQDDRRGHGLQ